MKFEIVNEKFRENDLDNIKLPTRATEGSNAYDFYNPTTFIIQPGETKIIWTDIKIKLDKNKVFLLLPRSSIGIKKHLMLANTMGIIDSDYYSSEESDGNIGMALYNYGNQLVRVEKGERIVQGFITDSYLCDDDNVTTKRKGGMGSSGS